jgi:hypothetical protein
MTATLSPEDPRNRHEPAIVSPEGARKRPEPSRAKAPYCDIFEEFIAVQEPSGPCGTKHVVFRRDQKLSPYEFEVAKRHGVPIRWR